MKSSRHQHRPGVLGGTNQGKDKFFGALRRFQPHLTGKIPTPGSPWEAWAAYRIDRLESQQSWMMRLIIGALIMQVGLQVLAML